MLEQVSEHFELWEVLSEGLHMLRDVQDGIRHGRDSLGMRFQVHAPMSDVNIGSVYEPMRRASVAEIADVLSLSRALDIRVVTVHPGFVNGIAFLDKSQAFVKTVQSLKEIDIISKEHSVTVAVENMPSGINATCTTAQALFEAVEGTDLGICFDMGHANTAGEVEAMLRGVSRFRNVHLHNNGGQWDQHNRVDDGTADLSSVVGVLKASYGANIIVESTDLPSGVESRRILEKAL
jgi:sugar phosphate isomerase/epimerase